MVIYVLIFFIIYFFSKKKSNIVGYLSLLLLTIFRFDVGWDFRWYYHLATRTDFKILPLFFNEVDYYNYLSTYGMEANAYLRLEFLNRLLYKIIWYLNLKPECITIFYGTLMLFFLKKGLDYNKIYNKNIWLFFYTFPLFLFEFFSIQRQGVAVLIIFYSYRYIKEIDVFKYLSFVLFASLFHNTAILCLIFYFIVNIKITKILFFVQLIFVFFFEKIIKILIINYDIPVISNYKGYILHGIGSGGQKIYYFISIMYIFFFIIIFLRKEEIKKYYNYLIIVIFGCFLYLSCFNLGHATIRTSIYFFIYILYLIPEIEKIIKGKKIISIFLFFLLILNFLNDLKNTERSSLLPYKIINFKSDMERMKRWEKN